MAIFEKRSLLQTTLLTFCTFGFYFIYWLVVTKRELNKAGGHVPNAILMAIPVFNIYFLYRYAQNYTAIIKKDRSGAEVFLYFLIILAPMLTYFLGMGLMHIAVLKSLLLKIITFLHIDLTGRAITIYSYLGIIAHLLVMNLVLATEIAVFQEGYNNYNA